MAGAGYRTWTAGEVVTASNVQSYLQDQTVGVYAGTAARSSAILSPSEGQVSYRTDDDVVEVYNGSAWTPVAPTNSGLIHIETQSPSGVAAVNFNNIFSSSFTNYKIFLTLFGSVQQTISMRMRASATDASGGDYNRQILEAGSTTVSGSRATNQTSWPIGQTFNNSNVETGMELTIFNPFNAKHTSLLANSVEMSGGADSNRVYQYANVHKLNTSYDGFTIFVSGTLTGKISVYGLQV
jgi:hypothetical protein